MIRKTLSCLMILLLCNFSLLNYFIDLDRVVKWLMMLLLIIFYIIYSIIPHLISSENTKSMSMRLRTLLGGCELINTSAYALIAEVIILTILYKYLPVRLLIINIIYSLVLLLLMSAQGFFRLLILSKQIKPVSKIIMSLLWWVPVVNVFYIRKINRIARRECIVETHILEMNAARAENNICQTVYPILMVHGVFFRDWQIFNYWGRIPSELIRNGALVFYGNQSSALTIEASAKELTAQIKNILQETGADKLNIIAHSKGGLDSRYAITKLGMAPYVASLTTIGTPHYGCKWADVLLEKLPQGLINIAAASYNKMFKKVGDDRPDFLGAVHSLTMGCAVSLNREVPNSNEVLYQSYMSKMNSSKSAGFPLNFTYRLINKIERLPNDGLVPVPSAIWGNYQGLIEVKGRRGISHGDMIDLNRENIEGFEVREFYVKLIKQLKERGY